MKLLPWQQTVCALSLLVCLGTASMKRRDVLRQLLYDNKTQDYDSRVPPDYEEDHPTNVTIRIHLLSFDAVSETTMDYSVEIYLSMSWIDRRLEYDELHNATWLEVDSKMMTEIWVPDVYFRNEKRASFHNDYSVEIYLKMVWRDGRLKFHHIHNATWLEVDTKLMSKVWVPDVYFRNSKRASFHDVTVPNKYMHLYSQGDVNYSMRLSLTLSCRMMLQKYPLDTQRCPLLIQSYTYTTENVMFYWQEDADGTTSITHDEEIALNTELPQFSIVQNTTESCNGTMDVDTPKFACIKAYFTLKRDIRYYIIQVYVPSILIVALSWVSFWLDLEAIPARVSLGVLTVLTLNTHGSNVQAQLPKVSYIKAIDVWVVSSLIFVFAALLEFAYVNVLARRGDKERVANQVFRIPIENKDGIEVNGHPPRHLTLGKPGPSRIQARKVDKLSRILFPSSFIIFNLIYWIFYIYT